MAMVLWRNETKMIAKLTTNHDWLRVVATDAAKNKISLTKSRYRESCSGKGISVDTMRQALDAFSRLMITKTDKTVGQKMQGVLDVAQKATTLEEYITSLAALANA
jgi:hypothetical protein